jgi:hypothetical protein
MQSKMMLLAFIDDCLRMLAPQGSRFQRRPPSPWRRAVLLSHRISNVLTLTAIEMSAKDGSWLDDRVSSA